MNLKEAYSILEIPQTATPEEVKKKYRELTKKFHPDISKEADAESKFKKINEAYQVVSSGKSTDREDVLRQQTANYNPFGRQQAVAFIENIDLFTTISFKEAVLGCKKDLKFNRNSKCKDCNGQGDSPVNNGCDKCGGRGQVVGKQNNMVFVRTCDKCWGRVESISCKSCNGNGTVEAETSINVTIPGGRSNNDILRLSGMGHYSGNFGPFEQHTDAHLHITVIPEAELSIEGRNVIFKLSLPLLEAIQGCKKTVKTIDGDKEINVTPMSRNKEEIIIPRLGVERSGDQVVVLDVQYPLDITKLIATLSEKEK